MSKYIIIFIACVMLIFSCSEENNRVPMTDDPTIPGQVSNVRVEALPGAVKLTYDLPATQSLSYVKAECLINGVVRQVKASSNANSIIVNGFADESDYMVNLYSVSRSEKASEPVAVQVKPLTPPFQSVFQDIRMTEDWGGACVFFENPSEADLAITIIDMDNDGHWSEGETFYTKMKQGSVAVRGFEAKKTTFGAYIRDRWNNTTDTLVMDLTPRFEKLLDKAKFRAVRFPNDSPMLDRTFVRVEYLFDGSAPQSNSSQCFATDYDTAENWPHFVSFDMGVEEGAFISRFNLSARQPYYATHQMKFFEIWGSMDPDPDGSWESWTLLLEGEVIKPSGLPAGQISDEDTQQCLSGWDFSFPVDNPPVRYIRIKCLKVFIPMYAFAISEVTFWGQEPSDVFNDNDE